MKEKGKAKEVEGVRAKREHEGASVFGRVGRKAYDVAAVYACRAKGG